MRRAYLKPVLFTLLVSFGIKSGVAAVQTAVTAQGGSMNKEQLAQEAGIQTVVYGLPLVMMNITMNNFTNTPAPRGAPANQFVHERVFPPPSFKQVVRLNVDTLYSSAFLDLTKEPIVMSVPETHGRYYLLPLMDAWTNVFATPGLRTRGDAAANFLIAGPNWTGNAPAGMQILKSPTNMAWLLSVAITTKKKRPRLCAPIAVFMPQPAFKFHCAYSRRANDSLRDRAFWCPSQSDRERAVSSR